MRSLSTVLTPPAAGLVLLWLAPLPDAVRGLRADGQPGGDPTAAVVHLSTLAAWLLVGWLLLATAATLAGRLPGALGRIAAALARLITPALVRRALGGGAALSLVLSPALPPGAALAAGCAAGRFPTLDRASAACTPPTAAGAPAAAGTSPPHPAAPRTRTVVAGDTLWGLAAAELAAAGQPTTPARVAQRWPVWWQANRAAIGDDPDLIHIGTVLVAPDSLEKTR